MDNKIIVTILALIKLLEAIEETIVDPFLPSEGKRKHLTMTQVGSIIGSMAIVSAMTSPLVGKGIPVVGSKFTLIVGCIMKGMFTIMFGTLISLPDGTIFFTMCILEAVFMGIASAMILNACNTTVAMFFPNRISAMQGLTETAFFIGLTAGPSVGGFIFSVGGYKTPFYVIGFMIIATGILASIYLPVHEDDKENEQPLINRSVTELTKNPKTWVLSLTLFCATIITCSLNIILPLHLQETMEVSVFHTGLILMTRSGAGCLSSLIIGYYYNIRWMKAICVTGLVLLCLPGLLIGPSPLLPWIPESSLWLIVLCLVVMGVGNSCITTTMFESLLHVAFDSGFNDNLDTYSKISILFETVFATGALVGPVIGGFLFDVVGYKWTVTILSFTISIMVFIWCCVRTEDRPANI